VNFDTADFDLDRRLLLPSHSGCWADWTLRPKSGGFGQRGLDRVCVFFGPRYFTALNQVALNDAGRRLRQRRFGKTDRSGHDLNGLTRLDLLHGVFRHNRRPLRNLGLSILGSFRLSLGKEIRNLLIHGRRWLFWSVEPFARGKRRHAIDTSL
jgi:hypothetical protein